MKTKPHLQFSLSDNGNHSPQTSERCIEQIDSPVIREIPIRTTTTEHTREYKHVTDFTGPTVTHTTKVCIV